MVQWTHKITTSVNFNTDNVVALKTLRINLETIFHQIYVKAQSMTLRTFQMFFEACDILEWKSETQNESNT